jgi:hypothetical protein
MSNWIKLQRGNDWGHTYLAVNALVDGMASSRRGIKCQTGEPVQVRWPDGTIDDTTIVMQSQSMQVSDMGRASTVRSFVPGVCVEIHGLELWRPLDSFEVDLDWAVAHGAA